jgi:hypothetical protein
MPTHDAHAISISICTHAMHASPPPKSLLRCTSSARNICIIAMPWCVHGTCLCNMATMISNNDAYGACVIRLAYRHHYNVLHPPPNTAKGLACHCCVFLLQNHISHQSKQQQQHRGCVLRCVRLRENNGRKYAHAPTPHCR